MFGQGVRETFRIAGPIYRFKQVFGDLRKLRIPRGVRVRKDDYLKDAADEFELSLIALHDEVAGLKRMARGATRVLKSEAEPMHRLQQVEGLVRQMNDSLGKFQLLTAAPESAQRTKAIKQDISQDFPAEPNDGRAAASSHRQTRKPDG